MKNIWKSLAWASAICALLLTILGVYFQYTNVDMTSKRIVVEYWPIYAAIIVCYILAKIAFYKAYKK